MKKKIRVWALFLAQHLGAAAQLRFIVPFSYFPAGEFDFVYAPSLKAIPRLIVLPRLIIFHRDICPFREMKRIIKSAHSLGIITILDIDDILTQVPIAHPAYAHYQGIKAQLIEILKTVDIITVTNNRLKEYYLEYNPNVYVLSNFLDERIWNHRFPKREGKGKVVIGYAGLPVHVYDFSVVTPAIKYILAKYNGRVCFKFIGCLPDGLAGLSGIDYISELGSYQEYADTLMNSDFDFTIAPLEDNIFNRCKSNIKFLEYSICGYPGIYSAVGPYMDSIVSRESGILVKNETREWIRAMELLINNPELRRHLRDNAFWHVKENYVSKEKSKEWYNFYRELPIVPDRKRSIIKDGQFLLYAQLVNIYYKIKEQFLRVVEIG